MTLENSPLFRFAEVGTPFAEVGMPFAEVGMPFAEVGMPFAEVGMPYCAHSYAFCPISSPEDGNRSSFRNFVFVNVFFKILGVGQYKKTNSERYLYFQASQSFFAHKFQSVFASSSSSSISFCFFRFRPWLFVFVFLFCIPSLISFLSSIIYPFVSPLI
jgi:hypothetical protein